MVSQIQTDNAVASTPSEEGRVLASARRRPSIVVGIPTFNEEIAIGSVVLQARRYASEIVVVDDGSSDDTVSIARAAGATVLEHKENIGKGGAIKTLLGYVQVEDVDALVLLDGDGQHSPHDIPSVVDPVLEDGCDIVIGSRYLDRKATETPLYRRIGQHVLDLLITGSSGLAVSDSQSGFRALSSDAISRLTIRTDGMGVESEMISSAVENNLDVTEIPIGIRYDDVDGQTYNPLQHGISVLAFILQLIRDRHPLLFFGMPGLVLLTFGGALGMYTAWVYQTTNVFYQWRSIISAFLILLGTIGLFCGLVLSQIKNMIAELD